MADSCVHLPQDEELFYRFIENGSNDFSKRSFWFSQSEGESALLSEECGV